MKRKVWLEVTHIINRHGKSMTGIGYYTDNMVKQLLLLANKVEYIPFGSLFFTNKPTATYSQRSTKLFRLFPGKIWNQSIKKHVLPSINSLFGIKKEDIVIFFNYVRLPVISGTKTITTVYDLAFVHFPEYVDEKNRRYLSEFVPKSLEKSDHILTISEHAKKDIINTFKIEPTKITVVPPAIDHELFYPQGDAEVRQVLKKYNIMKNYILFVGTLEPRKNLECLIDAYALLDEKIKKTYSLVLAGGKGWLDEGLRKKLAQTTNLDIIETGYIDERDKAALYTGASVFVLPSHFEGFGMPILEAMACGTPVIAANNSSMPEVVGDAGIMYSTKDASELSEGLKKILTDTELAKKLIHSGLNQAKKYSWSKSARQLANLVDKLTSNDGIDRINF